jgi:hypothetical protein
MRKEGQEMDTKKQSPETTIEDSIQAGIFETLGCTVLPESDHTGHVYFKIIGDIDGCFKKLYANHLIGSMDALRAIKAARQAIYSLRKGKGNGQRHENFNR